MVARIRIDVGHKIVEHPTAAICRFQPSRSGDRSPSSSFNERLIVPQSWAAPFVFRARADGGRHHVQPEELSISYAAILA